MTAVYGTVTPCQAEICVTVTLDILHFMVTKTSSTGRESDKFMLRLPDGIRDRIAEAAKANNRTMNAELVARILQSLETEARLSTTHGEAVMVTNAVMEQVAVRAAKRAVAELRTEGLDLVTGGQARVERTPPPGHEAKD